MIKRRAIAGLWLLSALLFCALAAQGASAAESKNTTAYTCVKGGGALDFNDAHCDETTTPGKGAYGHELIPAGKTEIEITNKNTANKTTEAAIVTLKSTLLGSKTHTDCSTVNGTGSIENVEPGFKEHRASGSATINVSNCTVTEPAKCKVKEPIVWNLTFKGVDGLNGAEKNMGLEFAPASGKNFTEITFEGAECALKGSTFGVSGTVIGTGQGAGNTKESGATWVFSPEKEMEKLTWGGSPDEFSATLTTSMKGGGNPISLTTPT